MGLVLSGFEVDLQLGVGAFAFVTLMGWQVSGVLGFQGYQLAWYLCIYASVCSPSPGSGFGVAGLYDEGVWRFQAIRYRSTKLDTGRYESLLVYQIASRY